MTDRQCRLLVAVVVVITVIIIAAAHPVARAAAKRALCTGCSGAPSQPSKSTFLPRDGPPGDLLENPIDALTVGGYERGMGLAGENPPQRHSVYDTMNRFYTSADVDPLIMGQAYEFRDYTRDVYSGRTGVGGQWGLQEFTVDNQGGQTGVDVGPDALSEYEGSILGYNDGIPEQWAFPSTPMQWYRPRRADHYGHDGPAITNDDKLYPIFVPDHEPYLGADDEPYEGEID